MKLCIFGVNIVEMLVIMMIDSMGNIVVDIWSEMK